MPDTFDQLVVAIDGPSGSGKSSTARGVAQRLRLSYLDTGSMYRAATWLALRSGLELKAGAGSADRQQLSTLVAGAELEVDLDPEIARISVNGTDVSEPIRTPEVSAAVSVIATNLDVRHDLIARQRALIAGAEHGIVVEGRDITTVVAPQAQVRVLLVADPNARVARRQAELGETVPGADVTDQVIRRDADDSTVAAFTAAAPGVTVVDSTHLSLDEVIDRISGMAAPYVELSR